MRQCLDIDAVWIPGRGRANARRHERERMTRGKYPGASGARARSAELQFRLDGSVEHRNVDLLQGGKVVSELCVMCGSFGGCVVGRSLLSGLLLAPVPVSGGIWSPALAVQHVMKHRSPRPSSLNSAYQYRGDFFRVMDQMLVHIAWIATATRPRQSRVHSGTKQGKKNMVLGLVAFRQLSFFHVQSVFQYSRQRGRHQPMRRHLKPSHHIWA